MRNAWIGLLVVGWRSVGGRLVVGVGKWSNSCDNSFGILSDMRARERGERIHCGMFAIDQYIELKYTPACVSFWLCDVVYCDTSVGAHKP